MRLQNGDWPDEFPKHRYATVIVECFTGQALEAYASMPIDLVTDYEAIKRAVLKRFNVTANTSRLHFRQRYPASGQSYSDFAVKQTSCATAWVRSAGALNDPGKLLDLVILEDFINKTPEDLRVWLIDKKPVNVLQAAEMADDFVQTRSNYSVNTNCSFTNYSKFDKDSNGVIVQTHNHDNTGNVTQQVQLKKDFIDKPTVQNVHCGNDMSAGNTFHYASPTDNKWSGPRKFIHRRQFFRGPGFQFRGSQNPRWNGATGSWDNCRPSSMDSELRKSSPHVGVVHPEADTDYAMSGFPSSSGNYNLQNNSDNYTDHVFDTTYYPTYTASFNHTKNM